MFTHVKDKSLQSIEQSVHVESDSSQDDASDVGTRTGCLEDSTPDEHANTECLTEDAPVVHAKSEDAPFVHAKSNQGALPQSFPENVLDSSQTDCSSSHTKTETTQDDVRNKPQSCVLDLDAKFPQDDIPRPPRDEALCVEKKTETISDVAPCVQTKAVTTQDDILNLPQGDILHLHVKTESAQDDVACANTMRQSSQSDVPGAFTKEECTPKKVSTPSQRHVTAASTRTESLQTNTGIVDLSKDHVDNE